MSNKPATKNDVRKSQEELAGMMTNSFQSVTDDIKALGQRMDKLERGQQSLESGQQSLESGQASILKVVNSIDEQLKKLKSLPAKVERLHKAVFPHR